MSTRYTESVPHTRVAPVGRGDRPRVAHAAAPAPAGTIAALRGDDALARAAAEVAAPLRRLPAGLRDAHAEACLRIEALRQAGAPPDRRLIAMLARLLEEAEEQLRRIELICAQRHERPGGGLAVRSRGEIAGIASALQPAALLALLEAEERRGAREAEALRDLAHLAGQHLAARLLDITGTERGAAARDIAGLARHVTPGSPLRH